MKVRIALLSALLLAAAAVSLSAHDMFIKLDNYFLAPGDTLRVPLINGTFTKSENGIEYERIRFLVMLDSTGLTHPPPLGWSIANESTHFGIALKREGTLVLGLGTYPRELSLKGKQFNAYLQEEGITDILTLRKKRGQLDKPARERYAKYVKAVFQVGEHPSPSVATPLGFAAEVIPVDNPYVGQRSGKLRFQCLVDGKPVAGLTVVAGSQHASEKPKEMSFVTDAQGMVALKITRAGRWYVKFVRMVPVSRGDVDYESKWATLTFEVR